MARERAPRPRADGLRPSPPSDRRQAATATRSGWSRRPRPPAQQLRLDANARGLARDVNADDPRRPRQVLPFAQGQRADILVAHGALRNPAVLAREPPGQPAVAGIEEQ